MELENQSILFIVRTMGLGGTENVVLQLCEILSGKVNKIVVCSSGGVHEQKLQAMGIRHYVIPDVASKNPSDMLKTYQSIKSIIKKEQITIVHSHHRMAALYAELTAPSNIIKIANAHNTFQDKKRLTQFAYRNTNIVAVGEMVKKNLTEFFEIPDNQISVIHNAVKPFEGTVKNIEVLEKEKAEGHVLVGNIGRLSKQKGMSYFIDAAGFVVQKHPEARFVIVGDGELKNQLNEQVRSKKMQDKILFLGYRNDIQSVMSQLDFIVLSSLWEGLPLTPIEAYSVGKTVIGTAVDGTPEIIRDGVDGYLVPPKDIHALAEKITFMIENSEIKRKLEKNAKERFLDEFSFLNMADRYSTFYKQILESEFV